MSFHQDSDPALLFTRQVLYQISYGSDYPSIPEDDEPLNARRPVPATGGRHFSERNELVEEHASRVEHAQTDMHFRGVGEVRRVIRVRASNDGSSWLGQIFAARSTVRLVMDDATNCRIHAEV